MKRSTTDLMKDLDVVRQNLIQYNERLKELQYSNPENEALQEYINTLELIRECTEDVNTFKAELYDTMLEEDVKSLTVGNTICTLVKPMEVKSLDLNKFLETYKPETPEYKNFVLINERKGHITIKDKEKVKI